MNPVHYFRRIPILTAIAFIGANATAREPLSDGLGMYTRKITTASPTAQKYFNQGLGFYHGFSHGAAIRAFKEAAPIDPKCAMARWGIALANRHELLFELLSISS